MLIVCPSCTTAYRIDLSALGAAGRSVRCARCRHVWFTSLADLTATALVVPPSRNGPGLPEKPEPPPPAAESGDDIDRDAGLAEGPAANPDAPPEDAAPVTIENAPSLVPAIAQDRTPAIEHAATRPDIE